MADWWNPFDDEEGSMLGPSSAAPAPTYGTPRSGGGPNEQNFQLGGDAGYAKDYSTRVHDSADAATGRYDTMSGTAGGRSDVAFNRATPVTNYTGANAALGAAAGAEGQQDDVYAGLMNFASASGPGAGEATLREGANRSFRNNLAMARSGGGLGDNVAGLAAAQRANVDATSSAANEGARVRMAEDAARVDAFGRAGAVAGQRGGMALQRAGQEAGQAQFMTQAELDAQKARDAAALAFGGQELDAFSAGRAEQQGAFDREMAAEEAALGGRMGLEEINANIYGQELNHQLGTRELNQKRSNDFVNAGLGILSGAGSAAALAGSDRRMKKKVRRVSYADRLEALS